MTHSCKQLEVVSGIATQESAVAESFHSKSWYSTNSAITCISAHIVHSVVACAN
jgi:hypothetical protein